MSVYNLLAAGFAIIGIAAFILLGIEVIVIAIDTISSARSDAMSSKAKIAKKEDRAYLDGMIYAYWIISENIERGASDPCKSIKNEILRRAPDEIWRRIWECNGIKPRDGGGIR